MGAKTIKVIKRADRHRQEQTAEQTGNTKKTAQETARDMVATVTEWVNEFQQKRRAETSRAIKTLFSESNPQPGEA